MKVYHGDHKDLHPKKGPVSYTWDWSKVTDEETLKRKPVKKVTDPNPEASVVPNEK